MSSGAAAGSSTSATTGGTYQIAGYTLTLRFDDGRVVYRSIIADPKNLKSIWIDGRGYNG